MSYVDALAEAWVQHKAPRAPGAPTVISLFAGGGGSSLGYSMAGFRGLLAVEYNLHAAATYRLNFPTTPVLDRDITTIATGEALQLTGLSPGDLDVLDGSPPCQGFSVSGRRALDDPRNALFRDFVRFLDAFRPRVMVMENVSGLVKGKMRLTFAEIMRALKASGYDVSARLLNAMYFGVPQSRDRLIFIGTRSDLAIAPTHPVAETWPINVREALVGVATEPAPELTPKYRGLAPLIKPGQSAADVDNGKGHQSLCRIEWDKPAPTITRSNAGAGRATPLHPVEHRSLSIPEAKRLCGFPDDYLVASGSFQDRWAVLGNAVPPPLMRAIGNHVRREILG